MRRVGRIKEMRRKKAAYGVLMPPPDWWNTYGGALGDAVRKQITANNTTTTTPKKVGYIKTNPSDNTRVVQNTNVDLGTPDAQYRLGNITKEQKDFYEAQQELAATRNYYGITAPENATISQGRDYSQEERDANKVGFYMNTPYYRNKAAQNAAVLGTAMTTALALPKVIEFAPNILNATWNPATTFTNAVGASDSLSIAANLVDKVYHGYTYYNAGKEAAKIAERNNFSLNTMVNNGDAGNFVLNTLFSIPAFGSANKAKTAVNLLEKGKSLAYNRTVGKLNNYYNRVNDVFKNLGYYRPVDYMTGIGDASFSFGLPAFLAYKGLDSSIPNHLSEDNQKKMKELSLTLSAAAGGLSSYILNGNGIGKPISALYNAINYGKELKNVYKYTKGFHDRNQLLALNNYYDVGRKNIFNKGKISPKIARDFNAYYEPSTGNIVVPLNGLNQTPTKFKKLLGHEMDHAFQPNMDFPLSVNDIKRNPEYYTANINHPEYKNGPLLMFDRNIIKGKDSWNASPNEFASDVNGLKYAMGFKNTDGTIPFFNELSREQKNFILNKLFSEDMFGFSKKELKELLIKLSNYGHF